MARPKILVKSKSGGNNKNKTTHRSIFRDLSPTMMFSSTLSRNIGTIASRASARHGSTVARSAASAAASTNGFAATSINNAPRHHIVSCPSPVPTQSSTSCRSFSSMMPRRGFPQYTVFGPDTALSIRAVLPNFRRAGNDGVSVERRGKLTLEFIPRNNTGAGFAWQDKTVFSMSCEEIGLLLSQLPGNSVEMSHNVYMSDSDKEGDGDSGFAQHSGDVMEKVMTIEPLEGASLKFKIDYMKGGIGGQTPPGLEGLPVSTQRCIFY